jgi:hypothetical protein
MSVCQSVCMSCIGAFHTYICVSECVFYLQTDCVFFIDRVCFSVLSLQTDWVLVCVFFTDILCFRVCFLHRPIVF